MNWRKMLTAPARGAKALTQMVFRRAAGWRFWGLRRGGLDLGRVGDGTSNSTVMAPLLWIGRNFPEAPPALWEKKEGEEEAVTDHELLRLLERPNQYYSGALLWMATLTDWNVNGNAYWIKVRARNGQVKELWFTPSFLIEPKGDDKTFVTHYDYTPDATPIPLEPKDVVHFRYGIDSEDVRLGKSPLSSVLREVFTDDEAAIFTASLLQNMGVPGLVVSPKSGDSQPSPDDVKAVKEYVSNEFSGEGRGEPLVMSGPTDVEQFGFSPEQMDLKNLRRIPEERVSGVLGLPAIVAGLGAGLDRSTFANYGEAREAAYEDNIIPAQRILAEEVRFQLLTDFVDDPWKYRFGFDLRKVRVLQEDQNKKVERMNLAIGGGWAKVAEGRRLMDLEVRPEDEIYLRPLNLIATDPAATPEDEETPPPGEEEEPPAVEPEEEEEETETSGRKQVKSTRAQLRYIVQLARDEQRLASVFSDELEADFNELGKRASALFSTLVEQGAWEETPEVLQSAAANGHAKRSDESIATQITVQLGLDRWIDGKMQVRFEAHYKRTLDQTIDTLNGVFKLGLKLEDHVERAILKRGATRRGLLDVSGQTRSAILRGVAAGREAGEGPIQVARRIRSEVPAGRFGNAGPAYRSQLIARTETKVAQNISSVQAYKESPSVLSVTVFDGHLPNSDEDCEARDGTTCSFEEAEQMLAEEHPNGTLSFAPNVAETPSQLEEVAA